MALLSRAWNHVVGPRRRLLRYLPERSVGAEVGVWEGDFSRRIIDSVKPSMLYLVDPWRFEQEYAEAWYGGAAARSQSDMDQIHANVVSRFANDKVTIFRVPSTEADIPDHSLDWVYIDGDHTYEHVLADLRYYATKVRPGGLITGDDYGIQGWWFDGVTVAVDEFVASAAARWERRYESQFVLRTDEP
jgi:hypothetical protein